MNFNDHVGEMPLRHTMFARSGPAIPRQRADDGSDSVDLPRSESHGENLGGESGGAVPTTSLSVLIITSEAPPVISGISRTVSMLTRGLVEQGHTVDVISRQDFPRFLRGEFRLSAFVFYWPSLRRRLRAYDVVNLHGPVPSISEVFLVLARSVSRLHRPALVYTHHSDLAIASLERICNVYNRIVGQLAQTADAVVVSSNAYQGRMWRSSHKPVSVIPWAVESTPSEVERALRPAGRLRVLFVGQLRSYKGLHVLLDAVKGLSGVTVSIVGNGPLKQELEKRLLVEGLVNVTLTGRLSDDELADAYRQHDVIALPSITTAEAYGLVLAEGMAAGCVPVASALPGVRELASETGYAVPPGNAAALREILRRLAGDPVLVRVLAAASLLRSTQLSVEAMASQYGDLFHNAVNGHREYKASEVVPPGWSGPDEMLAEVVRVMGVRRASVSLIQRSQDAEWAQVWSGDGRNSYRRAAPVAAVVASMNRPVLITPGLPTDPRLVSVLLRHELTSSILLPIRASRQGVSILSVATTEEDQKVFGRADLYRLLRLVSPSVTRQPA